MAEDRSYIDVNTRERERLRAFIEGLDDEALAAPANAYWTTGRPDRVVGVERRHPVERELRDAAVDLLGDLQGELRGAPGLDRVDDRTRRRRGDHRGEHLDELEAAVRARG